MQSRVTNFAATFLISPILLLSAPSWADTSTAKISPDINGGFELVADDPINLNLIDGLAVDDLGNLFGVLEIGGAQGAFVFIDTTTGNVTSLVSGLGRADQVGFLAGGVFFVTNETSGAQSFDRLFRIELAYQGNIPVSATAISINTSLPMARLEGLVVIRQDGAFGTVGTLFVVEDINPGRLFRVDSNTGQTEVFTSFLFDFAEGMTLGDFNGALSPMLFIAETGTDRILSVTASGVVTPFGDPLGVALINPDNVQFGPDGFLYITEDRNPGRLLRVDADGQFSVVATGFQFPQGLAFDPLTGDLYLSEQGAGRIWRLLIPTTLGATQGLTPYAGEIALALDLIHSTNSNQVTRSLPFALSQIQDTSARGDAIESLGFGMLNGLFRTSVFQAGSLDTSMAWLRHRPSGKASGRLRAMIRFDDTSTSFDATENHFATNTDGHTIASMFEYSARKFFFAAGLLYSDTRGTTEAEPGRFDISSTSFALMAGRALNQTLTARLLFSYTTQDLDTRRTPSAIGTASSGLASFDATSYRAGGAN